MTDLASTGASRQHVRRLLLEWDAIGVADMPEAANEYDCMIGPLLAQLSSGVDARTVAGWIRRERVEHFGLRRDDAGDTRLAEALVEWRDARTPVS